MSISKFETWFPDEGQDERDARFFAAHDASDAAVCAAEVKCQRDAEWYSRIVRVRDGDGAVKTFDVEVVAEPNFYAREQVSS